MAQFPSEMGRIAVETALKAMKGEAVPADVTVRIGLITRENVSE